MPDGIVQRNGSRKFPLLPFLCIRCSFLSENESNVKSSKFFYYYITALSHATPA